MHPPAHPDICDRLSGNARSWKGLADKFSVMQGMFRLHVQFLASMKQSGASTDDVDNCTKHKHHTAHIFFEHNQQERPMSVAPFTINGGTAYMGGQASPFAVPARRGAAHAELSDANSEGSVDVVDVTEDKDKGHGNASEASSPAASASGSGNINETQVKGKGKVSEASSPAASPAASASGSGKGKGKTKQDVVVKQEGKKQLNIGGSASHKHRPTKARRIGAATATSDGEILSALQVEDRALARESAREERLALREMDREERESRRDREREDRQAARDATAQQNMLAAQQNMMTMIAHVMGKRD